MNDCFNLNDTPIYPNCARVNYNVIDYADTTLRNYWKARNYYQQIDVNADDQELEMQLVVEHCRISVVFSAMCIEAFLNDYAAACLGDDEFYSIFDKLSTENKFLFISKFILKAEYNKGESYYCYLKELFRKRNSLVHSKSKAFKGNVCVSQKEVSEIDALMEKNSENIPFEIDLEPFREEIRKAHNGLCAMRDIAIFFDKHDTGIGALARMFMYGDAILDENGIDVRNDILKELKIKNEVI